MSHSRRRRPDSGFLGSHCRCYIAHCRSRQTYRPGFRPYNTEARLQDHQPDAALGPTTSAAPWLIFRSRPPWFCMSLVQASSTASPPWAVICPSLTSVPSFSALPTASPFTDIARTDEQEKSAPILNISAAQLLSTYSGSYLLEWAHVTRNFNIIQYNFYFNSACLRTQTFASVWR